MSFVSMALCNAGNVPMSHMGLITVLLLMAQTAQGAPSLWGKFYLDGCDFTSENVTSEIDLNQLVGKHRAMAIQLEIYGTHSPRLETNAICKLPSSDLYRLTFAVKGQLAQLRYQVILSRNNGSSKSAKRKEEGFCTLSMTRPMKIFGGYGFLSCRDLEDLDNITAVLKEWKEAVNQQEIDAQEQKTILMGSIGGGVILLISACVVCIVLRIKATKGQPMRSAVRSGTPARSVQTRVTTDQTSSTKYSTVSHGGSH